MTEIFATLVWIGLLGFATFSKWAYLEVDERRITEPTWKKFVGFAVFLLVLFALLALGGIIGNFMLSPIVYVFS